MKFVVNEISVRTVRTFSASHILEGIPKCEELHGHNWKVEIIVSVDSRVYLNNNGMIINFSELKKIVDAFDHTHLNKFIEVPTAENLSLAIADKIAEVISPKCKILVKVWETENSYAKSEGYVVL